MSFLKELSYFLMEAILFIFKAILGVVGFLFIGIAMFIMYIKQRADRRAHYNHWRTK